ncbi:MAG: DUF924 domain-containing protein [Gemmatimonadaceae bacterium]|nr:DUF924 domain-containing protein [Gloeobacterales cyanobacterium ES-bin-141]
MNGQPDRSITSVNEEAEEVLGFWFPNDGEPVTGQQFKWWMGGGADTEVLARFPPLLERAERGELASWSGTPRSRLALIIILDQFSRTIHRGTARAFAQDPLALSLVLEGINIGHYSALATPWEKTFFLIPIGHCEDLTSHQVSVRLAEALVEEAPPELREVLEFSASQARGHRDVIVRFGRHPHRNAVLGRESTPAELEYLATGRLVHTRSMEDWQRGQS